MLSRAKEIFFSTVKTVWSRLLDHCEKISIVFAFSRKDRSCKMKIMKEYLLFKVILVNTYLMINFRIYACYSSFLIWWKNGQINANLLREICRFFLFFCHLQGLTTESVFLWYAKFRSSLLMYFWEGILEKWLICTQEAKSLACLQVTLWCVWKC